MLRYLLIRIGLLIPTLLGLMLLTFVMARLMPGDAIEMMAGEQGIDPVRHAQLRHAFGLDQPLLVQFGNFLLRLSHGDLGVSMVTSTPVIKEFAVLFPATVELSVCGMLFAVLVGIPAGVLAAVNRNSIIDHGLMGVSLGGYSIPTFWWGLLAIMLFSNFLHLTPVSGRISAQFFIEPTTGFLLIDSWFLDEPGAFRSAVWHLVLPAIVLGTYSLATIARITRSAMLEVLSEDYIRTARAKGLSPYRVIGLHALRNALIPVVTVIGLLFSRILTGAILVEMIFSWPGVGKWLVDAVFQRDYAVLQGGILLLGITVIAVNLVVDLLYGVINPRIRHAR